MGNLKKLQIDGVDILPLVSEYETYDSDGNSISNKYANKNTVSSQIIELSNQVTSVSNELTEVLNKIGDASELITSNNDFATTALNDVYLARDNMKQSIVNALSEKGVNASASETIESLISKIGTIEVGSDIPEWYVPTNPYSNTWTQATKMTGTDSLTSNDLIFGSTYTPTGNDIYFIGGAYINLESLSQGYPLSNVYCYNSINNSWSSKKGFAATTYYGAGTGVVGHASTYHNGYIYVCGGYFGSTEEISNIHYRYDVANNSWASRSALPYSLAYHSYHTIGNTLYAIGGCYDADQYDNPNVYAYNPTMNSWTTKSPTNYDSVGGSYEGAAVLNDTIYNLNLELATFSQYNPTTNTWTQKTNVVVESNMPPIVSALNGNIHAFTKLYMYDYDFNYHQCYNPTTDTWTAKANLPADIYAANTEAAVSNGSMYVVTNAGNHYCYIP